MTQFVRPISDLDNTGVWTTTPLWSKIDEGEPPQGDSIISDTTPDSSEPFTVDGSTIADPAISTGHILRARWAKNATGGADHHGILELRQGYVSEASPGTLIATLTGTTISGITLVTDTLTLSGAEADAITDYSDLQLRSFAEKVGGGAGRQWRVDFIELETPPGIPTDLTALSQADWPSDRSYLGPYKAGGAEYIPILGITRQDVHMLKATGDPLVDGNWATVDDAFQIENDVNAIGSRQDGNLIHVITTGFTAHFDYHVFNTDTETWTIKNEEAVLPFSTAPAIVGASVRLRSDGDVIVAILIFGPSNDRVFYLRREGGTWSGEIQVDDGGSNDWTGVELVKGDDDRMHFCFKKDSPGALAYQRTLTKLNVFETFPAAGDSAVIGAGVPAVFGDGITFNDGTPRIRVPYLDANQRISLAEFDSIDAPGAFSINADFSAADAKIASFTPLCSLAVNGTDVHMLYARDADSDLYHSVNGGAEVEILDGVTMNFISTNIYNRSGLKLAFVYVDGVLVKYGEVDIAAAPAAAGGKLTSSAMVVDPTAVT